MLIPTQSNTLDIDTHTIIDAVSLINDKELPHIFRTGSSLGPAVARNSVLEQLRKWLESSGKGSDRNRRCLWLDDDMVISDDPVRIAAAFSKADKEGLNIIGYARIPKNPYLSDSFSVSGNLLEKTGDFTEVGSKRTYPSFIPYGAEKISALKPFDPLPNTVGGLAFYYGDTPIDYKFHIDDGYFGIMGEDTNFFVDNGIKLNYFDVKLYHRKTLYI